MSEPSKALIGGRVRRHREYLRLTRERLAELSGLSVQFLSDIELGRKNMSARSLYRVAQALNLSADYILFGEEPGAGKPRLDKLLSNLSNKDMELAEEIILRFVEAVKNR